jgi:hypothetical protein
MLLVVEFVLWNQIFIIFEFSNNQFLQERAQYLKHLFKQLAHILHGCISILYFIAK